MSPPNRQTAVLRTPCASAVPWPAVPPALYHIIPAGSGWAIGFGDHCYGHETLTAATIAAVKAARSSAEKGHSAQVLMQRHDGAWGLLWDSDSCQPDLRLADRSGNDHGQ